MNPMIVLVPDLHIEDWVIADWEACAQWIVDNATTNNIVAVVGEGDFVTTASTANFAMATVGFDIIDVAGIPYVMNIGNHDYDDPDDWMSRIATYFHAAYPLSRFYGKNWYGGSYDGTLIDNMYARFSFGGHDYLMFSLEFHPRTAVLAWALSIVRQNPRSEVMITTHNYLWFDGTIEAGGLIDIWNDLAKHLAHGVMITCGHNGYNPGDPTSAIRQDTGGYGKIIPAIFCNHQNGSNRDALGLLTLTPGSSIIDMKEYCPVQAIWDGTGAYMLPLRIDRARATVRR